MEDETDIGSEEEEYLEKKYLLSKDQLLVTEDLSSGITTTRHCRII